MASITDYPDNFKPYNGIGANSQWRSASTLVLLAIAAPLFFCSCVRDEYNHFVDRQQIGEAQNWPSTAAQIGDCTVTEQRLPNGRSAPTIDYHVKVEYKYTVTGAEHFSSQVKFLDRPYVLQPRGLLEFCEPESLVYAEDQKDTLTKEFAPGTHVTVRYNPAEPEIAYVETAIAPDSSADFQRRMLLIVFVIVPYLIFQFLKSGVGKMR